MAINTTFRAGGRSVVQRLLVETGFCHGATVRAAIEAGFRKVHSIELDPARYVEGRKAMRTVGSPGAVTVHLGTSPDVLRKILDRTKQATLYLDAHYSGIPTEPTDPVYGQCPLLEELKVVFAERWAANPIVVIDDAHMLDRPWSADLRARFTESHWPTRAQVLAMLPGYDVIDEDQTLYAWPPDCATPLWRRTDPPGGVRFTVVVPQGLGDIVWVYQKLAPFCDELLFRMVEFGNGREGIERRSVALIRDLPKVIGIDTVHVTEYPPQMTVRRPVAMVLDDLRAGVGAALAINPWLENGDPLESIDPSLPVQWDLGVEPVRPDGLPDKYSVLYVSGDTERHAELCSRVWPVEEWVTLTSLLNANDEIGENVVLLGASFDRVITDKLGDALGELGFTTITKRDLPLAELLGLFAGAELFVGYQSGLNVLAGAVGARQLMIYFPQYGIMSDSWVRPEHRGTGRFTSATFDRTPVEVAELLTDNRLSGARSCSAGADGTATPRRE